MYISVSFCQMIKAWTPAFHGLNESVASWGSLGVLNLHFAQLSKILPFQVCLCGRLPSPNLKAQNVPENQM